MTTTIYRPQTSTRTSTDILQALMHDALFAVAEQPADWFSSATPAGRNLLSLAAMARLAARALGADPGIPLTAGAGVVVVRDFAAAVRLLDQAVQDRPDPAGEVDGVLATAKGLHAHLLESVARA
jgi:hypothetical protein